MKITMTNREIGNNAVILAQLNEKGKLGYAIARNLRFLQNAGKEFLDRREMAIKKYGKLMDPQTGRYDTTKVTDKIDAELADIADIEHEVEIFRVSVEDFEGGELTSGVMNNLLWMVDDPEFEDKNPEEKAEEQAKEEAES